MHLVKDCTYSSHLCKPCNRVGHKEGYCGCFTLKAWSAGDNSNQKKGKKPQTKTKYQANIVHAVNYTGTLTRYMAMNGRQATLQLDSGSPITTISEETWLVRLHSSHRPVKHSPHPEINLNSPVS